MKIKGSIGKIRLKSLLFAFLAGFLICLPIRIIHVVKAIDNTTGFYTGYTSTVYVFFAILAVICLFMAIGGLLGEQKTYNLNNLSNTKIPGIAGLFLSLGFLLDSAFAFSISQNPTEMTFSSTATNVINQMKSGVLPLVTQSIFSSIAFIFFLIFSIRLLKKKDTSKLKILALAPVFSGIAKIITLLVQKISYVRISDLFLEICASVLLTVFFYSFAQINSGIGSKEAMWRIQGIGLPAALISLVLNLPKLLFIITGKSTEYINNDYPMNYVELFAGLFILALILVETKKESAEEIQPEEQITE